MKKSGFIIVLLIVFISCIKEDDPKISKKYNLSGLAQKGPFLTGSDVTIIELNDQLIPTGKVFFSTVEDNSGYFTFPDVEFESDYIQLKVEGLYYNEVFGGINMMSEIILQSIADISGNSEINVNLLTHLVQARAIQLSKSGMSFTNSHKQAYDELLSLFYIENPEIENPENLDLTSSESDGGVLLLVSSIIQSNIGSGMIFSEFLTSLTNDFSDNGTIDSQIIQRTLSTSALVLNPEEIRQNLISRYSDIGKSIDPYSGNQFLKNYNNSNTFPSLFEGFFPSQVGGSANLINKGDTIHIDKSQLYTIAVNKMPESGISNIQIAINSTSGNFSTSGVEWYIEGNTRLILLSMDGSITSVPIEFSDTGSLSLEVSIVTNSSGMVKYPKIVVLWD